MIPKLVDNYTDSSSSGSAALVMNSSFSNNQDDFDMAMFHQPQHDHAFFVPTRKDSVEWDAPVFMRKQVSFAPMTQLHPTCWTPDEIETSWYTKDELADFKQDRKALVSALKRVRFDLSRIDTNIHELRGYEAYFSIETNKAYKRHRQGVVRAVLHEQARQRYLHQPYDAVLLQRVSQHASQWATTIATHQGVQDAQYVFQLFLAGLHAQQEQQQQQQQQQHQLVIEEDCQEEEVDMDMELTALERMDDAEDECDFDCEPLPIMMEIIQEYTPITITMEGSLPQVSWHSSNHSAYSNAAASDPSLDFSLSSIQSRAPIPRSGSGGSRRYSAPAIAQAIHNSKHNALLNYSNHSNTRRLSYTEHNNSATTLQLPLSTVLCGNDAFDEEEEDFSQNSFS